MPLPFSATSSKSSTSSAKNQKDTPSSKSSSCPTWVRPTRPAPRGVKRTPRAASNGQSRSQTLSRVSLVSTAAFRGFVFRKLNLPSSPQGNFDLDPDRTLDIVLDIFSDQLVHHHQFFLDYISVSPWDPRKKNSASPAMDTDAPRGVDVDVGLDSDTGSSLIGQVLGFKFSFYQVVFFFLFVVLWFVVLIAVVSGCWSRRRAGEALSHGGAPDLERLRETFRAMASRALLYGPPRFLCCQLIRLRHRSCLLATRS